MKEPKKKKTVQDLNKLYEEADTAFGELFAEQRNNLLLVNGQHYSKRGSQSFNRIRDSQDIPRDQKLRLVKNHIQKISKSYKNNIISYSPGVTISPKSKSELQDMKAAEQHNAVWEDIKLRHKLKRRTRELIGDFVDIGEMIVKVGFDYDAGRFIGDKEVVGPDGNWVIGEDGNSVTEPVFSGDHTFERLFGFNVLCDPIALSFDESRWVIVRKMLPTKDVQAMLGNDEEKIAKVKDTQDERYKVWSANSGGFKDTKGMAMVREYYFRKCTEYPNGYYFITCGTVILFEGDLPLGLFPIIYAGFDDAQTYPRCYSIIKQLRPYQAEINRTASKIAEHQITLGDDKLVLTGGSKIAHGGTAHGVKAINVTGSSPTVIPGRTGDQFVGYMTSQIAEMYQAANLSEDEATNDKADTDAYARLFSAVKNKKRFILYTDKVESFLIDMADLALRYAKEYYTDDMIVPAVGRKEQINIAEFKNSDDLSVQVIVEPGSDDVETRMGRQLIMNHAIQFIGPQLDKGDIGVMLKNMPYGNFEGAFEDFTMDSENANNDLLSLDRGKVLQLTDDGDNLDYLVKKLTNRMKKPDFDFLTPQIKMNYTQYRDQVRQKLADQQKDADKAKAGFVPTGGYLVGCDFFVEVGAGKAPKRARVPYEALNWLMEKLDSQGTTQKSLNDKSLADQAGIGQKTQPVQADQSAQQPGIGSIGAMQPQPPGPMM